MAKPDEARKSKYKILTESYVFQMESSIFSDLLIKKTRAYKYSIWSLFYICDYFQGINGAICTV